MLRWPKKCHVCLLILPWQPTPKLGEIAKTKKRKQSCQSQCSNRSCCKPRQRLVHQRQSKKPQDQELNQRRQPRQSHHLCQRLLPPSRCPLRQRAWYQGDTTTCAKRHSATQSSPSDHTCRRKTSSCPKSARANTATCHCQGQANTATCHCRGQLHDREMGLDKTRLGGLEIFIVLER